MHPYSLVSYNRHWYMVGLDLRRGAERTFPIDRMQTVRALDGEYTSRPFLDERGPLDLAHRFATEERTWQVSLRIQADEESILAHLPASVAVVERLSTDDGEIWCRASISAERLEWIPGVLVGLGCAFVIESPEELRRVVDDAAERLRESARR